MMKVTKTTVDFIAKLNIVPDDHFNEIRTLQTLTAGLFPLYKMVKSRELEFEARCGAKCVSFASFGRDWDGTRDRLDTIACFFHWFGVSICNFARLVGFIHALESGLFTRADLEKKANFKTIKSAVEAYVKSVTELTNVQIWRNKVGAHFAITDPLPSDNIATLDMSVVFPVSFEGRYAVSGFTMTKGNTTSSHTSQIPRWSLTEVFESLIPRYWAGCPIPTREQLQSAAKDQSSDGAYI